MQDPVLKFARTIFQLLLVFHSVSSLNKTVLVTSRLIRPDPVYVSDNFDAELRKVSAVSLRRVNTSLDTSRFLLFSTDVTYRIDYAEVPTWITIAFKSTATVALEKFRWDRPTKVCEYQLIVGSPAGIDKHPERKIIIFRIHVPPGCQPSFALITTHEEEGKSYPYDWNVPQEVCDGQVFVTSYGYENPHMGIVNVVQNTGTEGYNMTRNFYCRKYPVVFDVEVFFVGNGMLTLMILGSKSLGDFNMSVIDDNWPYRVGDAKEVGIFWQQDGAKIKTRGLFVKVNVAKAGVSATSKETSSPMLFKCGTVVCNECWKEEMARGKALWKHRCSIADKYSVDSLERQPFRLWCNHMVCNGCFEKTSTQVAGPNGTRCTYKCPICQKADPYLLSSGNLENCMKVFLQELPTLTEQLKEQQTRQSTQLQRSETCAECDESFTLKQMFECDDCKKRICGACCYRRHRTHKVVDLLEEERSKMLQETKKSLDIQINAYEKIFRHFHQKLIEEVQQLGQNLLNDVAKLDNETFNVIAVKTKELRKLGEQFETFSEDYLPHLRKFDTQVSKLLKSTLPKTSIPKVPKEPFAFLRPKKVPEENNRYPRLSQGVQISPNTTVYPSPYYNMSMPYLRETPQPHGSPFTNIIEAGLVHFG
ncbi:unnamed protein product, partial [Mesorhabditis belari]|uniref:B box-type domain-containing protein n=1 Tax=Mesorhabditis belari TaxID=2138241 RepID=A0AAF3ERQ0_9BILA